MQYLHEPTSEYRRMKGKHVLGFNILHSEHFIASPAYYHRICWPHPSVAHEWPLRLPG